ncbi:Cyclic nucleotide-gated cation channel subunit A [Lucilia cuprina]|nr:Cyclic nucleotide-gated cation channel subunit A [Lucilia cuprina]
MQGDECLTNVLVSSINSLLVCGNDTTKRNNLIINCLARGVCSCHESPCGPARGDRANSMMARRRNEVESPKYGYNLNRPMYRSIRHNNGPSSQQNCNASTLGSSYPYTTSTSHHYGTNPSSTSSCSQHQQQQHHHRQQHHIIGIDDVYTNPVTSESYEMEDSTSLFSPLTPTSTTMTTDTAVLIARKHMISSQQKHGSHPKGSGGSSARNYASSGDAEEQSCFVGSQAAVVRLPSRRTTITSTSSAFYHESDEDDDDDNDADGNSNGDNYGQIVKCSDRVTMPTTLVIDQENRSYCSSSRRNQQNKCHHRRHQKDINEDFTMDGSSDEDDDDDMVNEDDDDDDGISEQKQANYKENIMENGKKLSQDPSKRTKPSTLRRTLNALRQRLTKRNRSKPPDWFLERFSNTTNTDKIGKTPPADNNNDGSNTNPADSGPACEIRGSSRLCNRLSVNPTLQSHYRWLAIVSLAVLYNIIFVVGRSVFWEINLRATPVWYFLDYLCDFIYLLDTLVHMHEGYLDQGLLVRDAYKLRRHYFTNKGWYLDVLSMLPTDLSYIWWSPSSCGAHFLPCAVIVRLNRLLRLPRMWEWFDRTETATGYPNAFRICKVVLAILVLIHWNACMYFAISYALGFGTDNWVYHLSGERNGTLQRQYIYSFYWSTLTLTTIGETPTPENDAEYLFVVADFLAGVLIFATIVGNIAP